MDGLQPVAFADLAGWDEDDHGAALAAFARHATDLPAGETYRKGLIGLDPGILLDLSAQAGTPAAKAAPKAFFEANFRAVRIGEEGKVTAFYEPLIAASRTRTGSFNTPFLRRPQDLVAINDANRPAGFDMDTRFGRLMPDGTIAPYHDRAAITAGALDGLGLEIAFVEDPVDAFFAHIQGAARLVFADGSMTRITYDGKSGHPFTGIGRVLVSEGALSLAEASMHNIRLWLANNPEWVTPMMNRNRSYIFFCETPPGRAEDGPVAAAKIPLTAGRSLAVDRLIHTFATPVHVDADNVNGARFHRLMVAQETGTAIVGPARGDLFMGSGDQAGNLAGNVNTPCRFTLLVPRTDPLAGGLGP